MLDETIRGLSIQDYISFLQRYILVHSYLYYEKDRSVITDREYDAKAKELVKLKNDYPELWRNSQYYAQFGDDYTGVTGFTLFYVLSKHQQNIIASIANNIKYI